MRRALVGVGLLLVAISGKGAAAACGSDVALLERFFDTNTPAIKQYRALRHLEARNDRFGKTAWMNVWTAADASGFYYDVVGSGGSSYIYSRVFVPALEAERDMWASDARDH